MEHISRSINKLRDIFFEEGEKKISNQKSEFLIESEYKRVLYAIIAYMSKNILYENNGGSFRKGLLLKGPNGSGKTTIFSIFNALGRQHKSFYFPIISCSEVVTKFNSAEFKEDVIKYYSFGNYCFDDLGKEPIASNFGKEDIFIRILENRYREFCEKGTKTFITTNLTLEQIGIRYGVHIMDRFYEMFNIHDLNVESFR